MRYSVLILLVSCYFGSSTPDGRGLTGEETVIISRTIELADPGDDVASSLYSLRVLAGADAVADYCQPGAAACAMILEGVIVYDGVDITAFIHELMHFLQWYADRNLDYGHEIGHYWTQSGGESSLQWRLVYAEDI